MVLLDRFRTATHGIKKKRYNQDRWNIVHEEGREVIQQWREKRLLVKGARKRYHEFLVYSFDLDTIKSFFLNFNFMVVIQMALAIISVYIFQTFNISFDVHVSLFVSPIVFPLAFSINTDFQRREKVLEDLAVFKSSGMVWYFCMREWKQAAELDANWIEASHAKLKSLLFHLREYLLTFKPERRKTILRAMYEDFSDTNQLIEKVRASKLPSNTAIVSRSIHLLNMMCLSFERLRVVREYRSPRSIRSFNKVFIMFLPIILSPYFVYLGIKSQNVWEPYYIAVLVAFVFSALQGTQDKLDDPFDGMSEDDIDLDTIDEWTFSSLEHTMQRTFDIGRFKVTVDPKDVVKDVRAASVRPPCDVNDSCAVIKRRTSTTYSLLKTKDHTKVTKDPIDIQKKYAPILEGLSGESRITRKSIYRKSSYISESEEPDNIGQLETIFEPVSIEPVSITNIDSFQGNHDQDAVFLDEPILSPQRETGTYSPYHYENSDQNAPLLSGHQENAQIPDQDVIHGLTIAQLPETNIDEKPPWIETCSIQSDVSKTPDACATAKPDSLVNRFRVKSQEKNVGSTQDYVSNKDTSKVKVNFSDLIENNVPPKSKFSVKPFNAISNINSNRFHSNSVTDEEPLLRFADNEDNISLSNSIRSTDPDSISKTEDIALTIRSSEELKNMPSILYLNGTTVKNKPDISVTVELPLQEKLEMDTDGIGVLGYLGNINKTNSSSTINYSQESPTPDRQTDKEAWEF